ncbi:MAG: MarR family transcriptional regulator [Labilithrix sp.]
MTPARFDVLCFARQRWIQFDPGPLARGLTTQRAITKALHLHPSTVSKLLKRLEEMGWITRAPDYSDARVKVVELTKLGVRKIWEAMRRVFRGRLLLAPFERIARVLHPTRHVLEGLDHLFDTLELIGNSFGDDSIFYYDYGSQQIVPFRFVEPERERRMPRIRLKPGFSITRPGTDKWNALVADYSARNRHKVKVMPVLHALETDDGPNDDDDDNDNDNDNDNDDDGF